jgi:hypothetical protein
MKDKDKLDKIISITRTERNYCEDYNAAKDLAIKIQNYWHKKGFSKVRVWLEPIDLANGSKRYDIRGNIEFNCASIKDI